MNMSSSSQNSNPLPQSQTERLSSSPQIEAIQGIALLILFFGVLGGWASFVRLDAGAVASGYVMLSHNRQAVQHNDGGTVERLYAREGDVVEKGQILAVLDSTDLQARVASLTSQLIDLTARKTRLVAEEKNKQTLSFSDNAFSDIPAEFQTQIDSVIARQKREFKTRSSSVSARLDILSKQYSGLQARIIGFNDRLASTRDQQRILSEELTGMRDLANKGLAPLTRVRSLERTLAELQGTAGDILSSIAQAEEALTENRSEATALRTGEARDVVKELRETEAQLADLLPTISAVRSQLARTDIRSPAAGTVVGSSIFTEGGVITPGSTIMEIVPSNEDMIVDAKLSPTDVDDITIGMRAEVKFTGLQGHGLSIIYGEVKSVSADRLMDENTGIPYFGLRVSVSEEELLKLANTNPDFILKPGLPADVLIPLRKRTAIQYLIEPLTGSLWNSFREN